MDRWPGNPVTKLLGIDHPVIQGGMIHNSGSQLTAAVSEAGGLGLLGAGGMRPDFLRQEIQQVKTLTAKPFGVNLPLIHKYAPKCLEVALEEGVRIFFTSAGSPKRVAAPLKKAGCTFVHVVASPVLALKCQEAGCDAVVCEGFEAGGHNGREELTTMVLTPMCRDAIDIPLISAGGIAIGAQIAAALALGADGVQIGSRFAVSRESSGHENYKQAVVDGDDTLLVMKKHLPVRLLKNDFRDRVIQAESQGASTTELADLLGEGRAGAGMRDGDLQEGELEIGQVAGLIRDIPTVAEIFTRLLADYDAAVSRLGA
jgi:enoyl-[acyl-carrier protein] reductase II